MTGRVVVLALALIGVGLPHGSRTAAAQATPLVWWALGDSYSSGEGIPGTEPKAKGATKDCSRASGVNTGAKAWAVVAKEKLAEPRIKSWAFVPCTGATSNDIAGQLGEAKSASKADKADIVTLSMGGNDIGFAEVIEGCIDARTAWVFRDIGCDVAESTLRSRIDMLAGNQDPVAGEYTGVTLPVMYDLIATKIRTGGAVVVLGYPQLVEEAARWDRWRRDFSPNCEGVKSYDVAMLRSVAGYLNQQIALAVQAANKRWSAKGVRFMWRDIATGVYEKGDAANQRHGLCGQNPWINGVTVGWSSGDAQHERSFHPKQEGHTETGNWLAPWMRSNLNLESMNKPSPPTPTSFEIGANQVGPVRIGMRTSEAIAAGKLVDREPDLCGRDIGGDPTADRFRMPSPGAMTVSVTTFEGAISQIVVQEAWSAPKFKSRSGQPLVDIESSLRADGWTVEITPFDEEFGDGFLIASKGATKFDIVPDDSGNAGSLVIPGVAGCE